MIMYNIGRVLINEKKVESLVKNIAKLGSQKNSRREKILMSKNKNYKNIRTFFKGRKSF